MIVTPVHQFEIRFQQLLDFPHAFKSLIGSYSKICERINVQNDNSRIANYELVFSNSLIVFRGDRLVLKHEGDLSKLLEPNAILSGPFFELFNKIQESQSFGKIESVLFYAVHVNPTDKFENATELKSYYLKTFFSEQYGATINNNEDIAIIIEKQDGNLTVNYTFGPYLGIHDLLKRNIILDMSNAAIRTPLERLGKMLDLRIVDKSENVSIAKYRELFELQVMITNKVFKKQ